MKLDVRFSGIKELARVFGELPRAMQRKSYYKALMASAGVVRDAAVDNLKSMPMDDATGTLEKNIRVYRLKKLRSFYRVAVRVRKGAVNTKKKDGSGNPVRVGLYGSVLEYGKKNQPPRSWIRKAIREERAEAIQRMASKMRETMAEAIIAAGGK